MIKGIAKWDDPSIRYDQTRNATEAIIRKILAENNVSTGFLESCGMGASNCLLEGLEYLTNEHYFTYPTGETIQMDDAGMMWVNDDKRGKYYFEMDNRYFDPYIDYARKCFDCAAFLNNCTTWNVAREFLSCGHGLQVCLKKPGHWIALVAYDNENNEIVYYDSWGGRPGLKNGGTLERMLKTEWNNVQSTVIVYPKREV